MRIVFAAFFWDRSRRKLKLKEKKKKKKKRRKKGIEFITEGRMRGRIDFLCQPSEVF